jgi:hypothetical protein
MTAPTAPAPDGDEVRTFTVARNPDPASRLPFLIRLPLKDAPLVLKAGDRWPRTAKVYCHRAEGWPAHPEIVDDVPVLVCETRGVAIDLVLDRGRDSRSQLVFTRLRGGREGIFWQTPRTTRAARPGVRVPTRRAAGHTELEVLVDTRERYPYRFAHQAARTTRRALPAGDYALELDGNIIAAVERKSLADLAAGLVDGNLAYQLAELAALPRAAVAVEDRYSKTFKLPHVAPGFVPELLATVQIRYPAVPIVFCDTRPLAEEWTYRFLGAALAYAQSHPSTPAQ